MIITTADREDIPELCVLLNFLFAQEAEFIPDHEAQARGLASIISEAEIGDILVARDVDGIIGMVNLLYTVSTALGERVAILEDMVVSPNCRAEGIGSKLIDHAIEFASEKGCKRVTLLADDGNQRAHEFYQSHGFSRSSMVTFRLSLSE